MNKGHKGQMSDRDAMRIALEALERSMEAGVTGIKVDQAIAAIRQALDHVPDTMKMTEPIIAGAVYDFAGFITTRNKVIRVGSTADAAPVADLVKEWANRRSLSLENAAVESWKKALAEPDMGIDRGAWDDVPDATKWVDELRGDDETEQEPVTWRNAAIRLGEDLYSVGPNGYYDMTASQWLDWALSVVNTAPPKREWVGLTETERINLEILMIGQIQVAGLNVKGISNAIRAVEQVLRERNT